VGGTGTDEMGEMGETVMIDLQALQALAVLILRMLAKRLDGFSRVDDETHELLMMLGLIFVI
jgi:hypothetical protein